MPSAPKKVPVEVVERARTLALTKQYSLAKPAAQTPAPSTDKTDKKKAREKVLAALKRLHPMD